MLSLALSSLLALTTLGLPTPSAPPPGDGQLLAPSAAQLTQFGPGDGPRHGDGVLHLLDDGRTPGQSNALAFGAPAGGPLEAFSLTGRLAVDEGGEGGALLFLSTEAYGERGAAPFVPSWNAPDLSGSFAVGIDVHDPPTEEPFGEWGNILDLPQRQVSLHWDGRELVKRVAAEEFRGDWAEFEVSVVHVCGGAEVSVRIGASQVYDAWFVPGMQPYALRVAAGAGTRHDAVTRFDLAELRWHAGPPATPRRPPLHVEAFNHVLTDNGQTAYETELDLPPESWAFGRVLLTLEIHDAGPDWDEWDRNGDISIWDPSGEKRVIVPFITSYRTECHWVVDVTPFRPWLSGPTRMEIAAGTTFYKNRGYMLSVSLDFHHALPADLVRPAPFAVQPLWNGSAHYRSEENHFSDFFEPQTVTIDERAEGARVFLTTTGHSQVGEFTPSDRELVFVPEQGGEAEQSFANTLWKADCFLNPNRPQFGTWKYPRAGWAPGDVVAPWWIDLTPQLVPGATAELRYLPQPYDFGDGEGAPEQGAINEARHVVRSYLIQYRTRDDAVPAPILRIVGVVGDSAAARAGLAVNDFLASYDGVRVDSVAELGAAKAAATEAGRARVPVVVYRGAERLELEMDAGQMGVNLSGG